MLQKRAKVSISVMTTETTISIGGLLIVPRAVSGTSASRLLCAGCGVRRAPEEVSVDLGCGSGEVLSWGSFQACGRVRASLGCGSPQVGKEGWWGFGGTRLRPWIHCSPLLCLQACPPASSSPAPSSSFLWLSTHTTC